MKINRNVSGLGRSGWQRCRRLALLTIMGLTAVQAHADRVDLPAIYGPSNLGTMENGTVKLEIEGTVPDSISPCISGFSGPSTFTWMGSYSYLTGNYDIATAKSNASGCTYTAIPDVGWIHLSSGSVAVRSSATEEVVQAANSTVDYFIQSNVSPAPRTGHLYVITEGTLFTVTITQYGNGSAEHSHDYTGTGTGELAVWRPSNGTWYVQEPWYYPLTLTQQWGLPDDVPVLGDYDGDGAADFTVWRPSNGTWYVRPSTHHAAPITQQWGLNGDIPVPADYDGDGKTDFAVFRPSNQTWYVINSLTGIAVGQPFGWSGDIPVPADYDSDGKVDIGVFRPATAMWYFLGSRDGVVHSQQLGLPGDVPVPTTYNDYRGYGFFLIWRPSTGGWYSAPFGGATYGPVSYGLAGDIPLYPIIADLAVWRPSTGTWYVRSNADGSNLLVANWGLPGDVIPGAPHTAAK
jgi:hypothetical protein